MSQYDKRVALAEKMGLNTRESLIGGIKMLLVGSGYHQIYNPYTNKEQAFELMLRFGGSFDISDESVHVKSTGEIFLFENYDKPHLCLCEAICESILK